MDQLTRTAKGRRLAGDPEQLWRRVAAILLVGDSDFTAYVGELFLAMLLEADSRPLHEVLATVWRAAGEEGFREDRTGEPPSEDDVSWAIHDTSNLCRALGLLTVGADWRDRSYGLTETGKATALEALRTRATARAPSHGRDVARMTTGRTLESRSPADSPQSQQELV